MNKVSIIMLVYNAPYYVKQSIKTLKENTEGVDYELIVVDNNSKWITKLLLKRLKQKGLIDKLITNEKNMLFAGGNNIGSEYCDYNSEYILLLNSDVKILHKKWLQKLIELHPYEGGVSSYGVVLDEPQRADGYCFLINKDLYINNRLDENFQWFWGVTKLQSILLKNGKRIVCVENHENIIHHYGGRSGKGFKEAKGMGIDIEEVKKWFIKGNVEILKDVDI
ncbi:glycosyltransferase family 2 protein [Candidatus Galacturonibacter soehngenii]|uniref:Glycosyltransferase n=1 Tax=Candidatus Galacturonatibacter soehngenii TaxID=2307010 RepID=A0A7V7QL35_9FIRM|nr:glycosyltransferase [Candidatus Galacturonibacter soehngenii]KAB1438241.1 glycosyltransferase [Candidatus Galacturonibacter soehngenii]